MAKGSLLGGRCTPCNKEEAGSLCCGGACVFAVVEEPSILAAAAATAAALAECTSGGMFSSWRAISKVLNVAVAASERVKGRMSL